MDARKFYKILIIYIFKELLLASCLFVSINIQAQNTDLQIGQLINESNWFELEHELKATHANSISPFLRQLATAMTHHYFNRPDSVCSILADLLNNHPQELGDQTMGMVILLSTNLARTGRYNDAAELLQNLYAQLTAMGTDSTLTKPYKAQAKQYRTLAACGSLYQQFHPSDEYRIPMKIGEQIGQHSIEIKGSINGKKGHFLFDTGAGGNLITPKLAKKYGLRSLDADITVGGVGGIKQGGYAIADTFRIGEMTWINVPFAVIDTQTGHEEADKFNEKPVIGLPIMFGMQEIQLDFAHREIIIPAIPTPNPLGKSNLIRTDTEGLQLKMADEDGNHVYFHFDTGCYYTYMQPTWYNRHQNEVNSTGVPDSLRMAGIGGVSITRTYKLPHMKIRIGNGIAKIDSVNVNTGIDLHTGQLKTTAFSDGAEDGVLGLNALEKFSKVIINLKDMYLEAIPITKKE